MFPVRFYDSLTIGTYQAYHTSGFPPYYSNLYDDDYGNYKAGDTVSFGTDEENFQADLSNLYQRAYELYNNCDENALETIKKEASDLADSYKELLTEGQLQSIADFICDCQNYQEEIISLTAIK